MANQPTFIPLDVGRDYLQSLTQRPHVVLGGIISPAHDKYGKEVRRYLLRMLAVSEKKIPLLFTHAESYTGVTQIGDGFSSNEINARFRQTVHLGTGARGLDAMGYL